ncbi:3-hydroxyacyl-CoA dehydrogenase NAD-binding domain-containing protein [uncultured Ferrovibrio sp.]|jgi:3-hydroxyacyl-CoA dehydrogenase/enoyl-CoA hydratase/3-hydroxybutyryl-CoA epimerase|uniref:3-hydroxyacyl-CoA dehydrogenase NAD-binding domain-containing protein n=1 Tax=uncultured Ferrovibrio sp. TaxID=1576913 RepID=UPI002627AA56|nr:3-hydroxyacyl-CoA dehydrogenase NAD-binding domain-containing protein [uncultured Ferrovibrio sp.]
MIDYSVDSTGVASIVWNMAERPMNVMNGESLAAFSDAVYKAINDKGVKGVIVTSAKNDFVAGADLVNLLKESADAAKALANSFKLQKLFRDIEKAGKPFVAAINGTALGGGYEICLACHRRIAADNPKALIGLPEATIGLLPGAGGTQRLPRMIGVSKALPMLLEGKKVDPKTALGLGMVDEVVPAADLLARAKDWILGDGQSSHVKPWDQKGFRVPEAANTPRGAQVFTAGNAMLRAKTYGNYPNAQYIMSCVYEGTLVDIDTGLKIESRYFVACTQSKEARNMIRSLFFSIGEANKLANRPKGVPTQSYTKIGILGAGMMGAGIAWAASSAGLQVVLLDTTQEAAEKGKAYSAGLLDKRIKAKKATEADKEKQLGLIKATTSYEDLKGCELVIEAVFEDRAIKADVTRKAEAQLEPTAIFASNTSTLPITGLAEASARPANFIGLHFFSPVDKMPLVEIIRGKQTSDETLARAMDFVKKIRKTPIVVNDSRGFYTSRVFATYVTEGLTMLAEGVNPAIIENAGKAAGMPVGPLALADEVSLELMHRVRAQTKKDLGDAYKSDGSEPVLQLMVEKLGRIGKKAGKGFYDYPADGKKRLWKGLAEHFPVKPETEQPALADVIKRLIYIQSVETARCIEEKVVLDVRDADVGSIMGWGFPPFRGGTISNIDTVGVKPFVAECDQLAQKFGARFTPPKLLRDMADQGKSFYTV